MRTACVGGYTRFISDGIPTPDVVHEMNHGNTEMGIFHRKIGLFEKSFGALQKHRVAARTCVPTLRKL